MRRFVEGKVARWPSQAEASHERSMAASHWPANLTDEERRFVREEMYPADYALYREVCLGGREAA